MVAFLCHLCSSVALLKKLCNDLDFSGSFLCLVLTGEVFGDALIVDFFVDTFVACAVVLEVTGLVNGVVGLVLEGFLVASVVSSLSEVAVVDRRCLLAGLEAIGWHFEWSLMSSPSPASYRMRPYVGLNGH